MTHERILVSVVYYYSTTADLIDKGLAFRVESDEDESGKFPGIFFIFKIKNIKK